MLSEAASANAKAKPELVKRALLPRWREKVSRNALRMRAVAAHAGALTRHASHATLSRERERAGP
jgi:hypothetical protein